MADLDLVTGIQDKNVKENGGEKISVQFENCVPGELLNTKAILGILNAVHQGLQKTALKLNEGHIFRDLLPSYCPV